MKHPEYKRGYANGYQARADKWPAHRPPIPPHPIIGELVAALQNLRDELDGQLATFEADDSLNIKLSPAIEKADNALTRLNKWLRSKSSEAQP